MLLTYRTLKTRLLAGIDVARYDIWRIKLRQARFKYLIQKGYDRKNKYRATFGTIANIQNKIKRRIEALEYVEGDKYKDKFDYNIIRKKFKIGAY